MCADQAQFPLFFRKKGGQGGKNECQKPNSTSSAIGKFLQAGEINRFAGFDSAEGSII